MARKKFSPAQRAAIVAAQDNRCTLCACEGGPWEYDHVIPLALGGLDAVENLEAVCQPCHRIKTKADVRQIAKAKRQKRSHEEGRGRKRRGAKIHSRPFRAWRSMDGARVVEKPPKAP